LISKRDNAKFAAHYDSENLQPAPKLLENIEELEPLVKNGK